jgi:hypothetical protein
MSRIRLHVLRSGLHWVLFAELCGDRIVKEPMDNEVSWMDAAWVMCGLFKKKRQRTWATRLFLQASLCYLNDFGQDVLRVDGAEVYVFDTRGDG